MFSIGASAVFACDVGAVGLLGTSNTIPNCAEQIEDNSPRNYGDTVSGWWLLLNRWNPFSNARLIPAIPEIQSRLA